MKSYSLSWNIMAFVTWLWSGIKSNFSGRQQFVQFNDVCSTTQTIKCGVPQGSIWGPLFFILYINDLPNASKLTQLFLSVADDISIFYSHLDLNKLHSILNDELRNFYVWLKCNKLSVNLQKTNSNWSSTYVSNLKRIIYLQKRVVRAIVNSDYRAHSASLIAKLGMLDIFQVNSFQIAKFMFCYHNQLLPTISWIRF